MTDEKRTLSDNAPTNLQKKIEENLGKLLNNKKPTYSGIFTFLFIIGINGFIAGVKIKDSDWLSKDWLGKDDVLGKDIPNGVLYILAGISLMLIGFYFAYRYYQYKQMEKDHKNIVEFYQNNNLKYPFCEKLLPVDGTENDFMKNLMKAIEKFKNKKNYSSEFINNIQFVEGLMNSINPKNYLEVMTFLTLALNRSLSNQNEQVEYLSFLNNNITICIKKLDEWEKELKEIENSKKIIENAKRSSITLREEIATTIKKLPIARFRCHLAKTIINSLEKNKEEKNYQEKVKEEIDHLIQYEILSYDESVKSKLTKKDVKNNAFKVKIDQQKEEFKKTINKISKIYLNKYVVNKKESGVDVMISELKDVSSTLDSKEARLVALNAQQGADLDDCNDRNIAFSLEKLMQEKFSENLTLQAARPSQTKVLEPPQPPMSDFSPGSSGYKGKPDEKRSLLEDEIPSHSEYSSPPLK